MEMIPMIPMIPQPQDVTVFVSSMAAAGTTPSSPRQTETPLLFAALLQEMLQPEQTGAGPEVAAVKQTPKGKGARPVKGQAGLNPAAGLAVVLETVEEQSPGQAGSRLSRLLASPVQLPAGQSRMQPSEPAASQSAELKEEGRNNASSHLSPVPSFSAALLQGMLPPAQTGAGLAGSIGTLEEQSSDPVGGRIARSLAMAAQLTAGQSRPQTSEPTARQAAGLKEGVRNNPIGTPKLENGAAAFPPPTLNGGSVLYPGAAGMVLPYVNGPPPEKGNATSAPVPKGTGGAVPVAGRLVVLSAAVDTGDGTLTLQQPRQDAAGSDSPAGMPVVPENMAVPGNAPENNTLLLRSLTPDSGGNDCLMTPHPRQTADLQSVRTIAEAPGPAEEPAPSTSAPGSGDRGTGRIQGGQSASGRTQDQAKPAATLPPAAGTPNVAAPQKETPAEPAAALARQTPATTDYGTLSGLGSIVPAPHGGVAAGPPSFQVEVVFVDPSAKGRTSSGNEDSEPGAKDKKKDSTPDLGITAARTVDPPGSNRFALQPKVEEPRNALHESILAQVKASVVSHDSKGNGMITVRLNPAELGDLQVNVRIENQRVMVEVISDNRSVRDALMGNLDSLKETFQKLNLNMERFNVSSGGGNGFGQGFREERGDQRIISPLPFSHEALPLELVRDSGADDWGVTENSLVNLRL